MPQPNRTVGLAVTGIIDKLFTLANSTPKSVASMLTGAPASQPASFIFLGPGPNNSGACYVGNATSQNRPLGTGISVPVDDANKVYVKGLSSNQIWIHIYP